MILNNTTWVVVDSETTGPDPTRDKPVEIAAIRYRGMQEIARWSTLVHPGFPIPSASSGIHHLIDKDVLDAPSVPQALDALKEFVSGAQMIVAHNATFDRSFLTTIQESEPNSKGEIEWDWLCTYRLARHLLPDAPDHKLGTLRYFRNLEVPRDTAVHRALGDVLVTAALTVDLVRLYEERSGSDVDLDELLEFSASYIPVRTWPFGKYFGRPIGDAAADYIRWALGSHERAQRDLDLRHSLEKELLSRSRRAA